MNKTVPDGSLAGAFNGEQRMRGNGTLREVFLGQPKDFLKNRFVYVVLSPRARGLTVGINMNPDKLCNFDCVYCEVNRSIPPQEQKLDVPVMAEELEQTLRYVHSGNLNEHPAFRGLPRDLLELRHVALSGFGEPTLCPNFVEAVQAVVHLRALGRVPYFKMVLITNGSALDSPAVLSGLKFFRGTDEVWIKLEAGTQDFMNRINRPKVSLDKVLSNILLVGRQRPVIIQSLFAALRGEEPPPDEIEHFAERLKELKAAGAQISMVQIYSANRPIHNPDCTHLKLKSLSIIAQAVRKTAELPVEVF